MVGRVITPFVPGVAPSDPAQLQRYISDLEIRLMAAFDGRWTLPEMFVPPSKLVDGMVCRADGTHWNPGGGRGVYMYDAQLATWVQLNA